MLSPDCANRYNNLSVLQTHAIAARPASTDRRSRCAAAPAGAGGGGGTDLSAGPPAGSAKPRCAAPARAHRAGARAVGPGGGIDEPGDRFGAQHPTLSREFGEGLSWDESA